jgi:hypothetical protein
MTSIARISAASDMSPHVFATISNDSEPRDFVVLCDGESDRLLFIKMKACHPLLQQIPDANVKTYDQARNIIQATSLENAIERLHQDDRPDFIFCHRETPVLVAELTQHAYTGDNGLQRFARFAAAAENGVPFIYFGPYRRVRDDELDGDRNASRRSLTSDVFEGMKRLSEVHKIPQIVLEWKTNESGLPATLPARSTQADILDIYGDLLNTIALFLFVAPLCSKANPSSFAAVKSLQDKTTQLASLTNTRFSDVKFPLDAGELRNVLLSLKAIIPRMQQASYFTKGKPDKTLAEYAIAISRCQYVQWPDGRIQAVDQAQLKTLVERILALPKFNDHAICFYTGYKWRSDPHCGVLVNIDYRLCRADGERFPENRSTGLVVVYPRISLSRKSETGSQLGRLREHQPANFTKLFTDRYGSVADEKIAMCLNSANLFGIWKNSTKQARLFRRYADIVILNDGIVLGESLAPDFT